VRRLRSGNVAIQMTASRRGCTDLGLIVVALTIRRRVNGAWVLAAFISVVDHADDLDAGCWVQVDVRRVTGAAVLVLLEVLVLP
jgi:hypothetical protein